MVGVLNLDKPSGMTSAAAVGRLRRTSGVKRVGHGGTLDPQASGVLPVFFGRATVLAEILSRQGKSYRGTIRFGAGSSTDDAQGVMEPAEVPAGLDGPTVMAALAGFAGAIDQRPPAYSAVKVGGERSYRRARQGRQAEPLAPRPVLVQSISLVDFEPAAGDAAGPRATVEVDCGAGFYMRSLARDLGVALGTKAHLEGLVRTRVGPLWLADAVSLADVEGSGSTVARLVQSPALALAGWLRVSVEPAALASLRHGRDIPAGPLGGGRAYAVDGEGRVLAIGRVAAERFQPRRLVELE